MPGSTRVNQPVGIVAALVGALGYASGFVIGAKILLDGGDPVAIVLTRNAGGAVLLAGVLLARQQRLLGNWRETHFGIVVGLLFAVQSWAIYSALQYIPIGVAAVLEYTAPLQVAVVAHFLFGTRLSTSRALLVATAVIGVALVVRAPSGTGLLSAMGIGLAMLASVLMAAKYLFLERVAHTASSVRLVFVMSLTVSVLLLAGQAVGLYAPSFPTTRESNFLLACLPGTFLAGVLGSFLGVRCLGATRASMLANVEPVIAMLLAAMVVSQRLSAAQLIGGAVVLTSVVLYQAVARRP